jgi:hypothetical protein
MTDFMCSFDSNNGFCYDVTNNTNDIDESIVFIMDDRTDYNEISKLSVLKQEIIRFNKKTNNNGFIFEYKNFKCKISFNGNYFSGQILEFDEKLKKYFALDEINNLGTICGTSELKMYVPHGGFVLSNGFSCGHCSDDIILADNNDVFFMLERMNNYKNTFKSERFVMIELQNIVNSIIKIALARS